MCFGTSQLFRNGFLSSVSPPTIAHVAHAAVGMQPRPSNTRWGSPVSVQIKPPTPDCHHEHLNCVSGTFQTGFLINSSPQSCTPTACYLWMTQIYRMSPAGYKRPWNVWKAHWYLIKWAPYGLLVHPKTSSSDP